MQSPRTIAAWAWTVFVFVLCWMPRSFVPEGEGESRPFPIPFFDKMVHFAIFFGFSFLWMAAGPIRARWVMVAGVVAAVVSELGQNVPIVNRDANFPDGLADVAGVVSGIVAFVLLQGRYARLRPPTSGPIDRLG